MKFIYTVANQAEFSKYHRFAEQHQERLQEYLDTIEAFYHVEDLPKAILLSGFETATQLLSNIPLPAFTNESRTVFCPDIEVWREIYLSQSEAAEVRRYYETALTENHVLQILGHEFVHHSNLFLDEAYEKARWFEEGMCEYISRKAFLTEKEFREEHQVNVLLCTQYESQHGKQPLEDFCADIYSGNISDIFYFYWVSYLAVEQIVTRFGGDVMAVFREYHRWFTEEVSLPLSVWFRV